MAITFGGREMEDNRLGNLEVNTKDIEAASAELDETFNRCIRALNTKNVTTSGERANRLKRTLGKLYSLNCELLNLFRDFNHSTRTANAALRKFERGETTREQVIVLRDEARAKAQLVLNYAEYAETAATKIEDDIYAAFDFYTARVYAELLKGRSDSATPSTAPTPPKSAEYILLLVLSKRDRENLIGDLAEEYAEIVQKHGTLKANFWYCKQAATSVAPSIKKIVGFGISASIGAALRRLISYFIDLLR